MFKFIKELIESFKEGIEEGKAELKAEEQAEYEAVEGLISKFKEQGNPTLENLFLALSCPFRSVLTLGEPIRLMEFGHLEEKEVESLKKLLKRDFGIKDAADVSNVLEELEDAHDEEDNLARSIFLSGLNLYILTSAVEVGYITFEEIEDFCNEEVSFISSHVDSWQQFGELFMKGECINNAIGRLFLKKNIQLLLKKKTSPWCIFSWESISNVLKTKS
ncbi:DUF1266 domain-containing protein [Prevotella fusca JCM 17724]|uniref:DUF1266 domain-containing protein n=3 Tax=Prevotella fusca TaxID=589436 RepID=A0A0K1NP33_9BACT|nr:hypothetical protein ADJ77_07555 [Prevotella fusca JCM 17724]QUB86262.1 DUF1266 domain-containing protein [Prevotella fusca JCM 17724]